MSGNFFLFSFFFLHTPLDVRNSQKVTKKIPLTLMLKRDMIGKMDRKRTVGRERISKVELAMGLAFVAKECSQDPYWQVGGCVLRENMTVAAVAFNGPPPGIEIDWSIREEKNRRVVHAEVNLLSYLNRGESYPFMCLTCSPCERCVVEIALYGIPKVFYVDRFRDFERADEIADGFGIQLIPIEWERKWVRTGDLDIFETM